MGNNEVKGVILQALYIWDYRFLDLAKLVASWSKDPSTQTGAVIVGPDKSVISVGFNGFPTGMPDDPELYANRDEKYSRIVHCEVNALIYAGRSIPKGSSLYTVPFMSCDRCVVQMLQAGIKRFVAPACPPDKAERWAEVFIKTRKYISECGGELIEL
jgi:dCMP deaminase